MDKALQDELNKLKYIWTTEKDDWMLIRMLKDGQVFAGYVVLNTKSDMAMSISHPDLKSKVVQNMLNAGNSVVDEPY